MKKIILALSVITAIAVISCNNNNSAKENSTATNNDSMPIPMKNNTMVDNNVETVATTFTTVDPAVSTFMKSMVLNYLEVKNALASDKETDAAAAAVKMYKAMKNFDKSLLNADQKKVYGSIEDDLIEHAEQISKNKIENQREHFAMMSKDMYDMVKAFGAGMTLYHDHCPMYKDGSMWLSETRDIKNPYYGDKMTTCGSVEEMMK